MYARAAQADEDAEFRGRPLWGGSAAVATAVVGVGFLDLEELGASLRVHLPHGFAGHAAAIASLTRRSTMPPEYGGYCAND